MKTISLDLRERILGAYDDDEGTREEAARRMGVSAAAFAQMEAKKARPRAATLKKIAVALGIAWEQLRD